MGINEIADFLKLLQKLPKQKQRDVYFMLKGAALVADKVTETA